MPLVRGLLLAHVCASALLLLLLWVVVLVQQVAARWRRTTGKPHTTAARVAASAAADTKRVTVPDHLRAADAAEQGSAAARTGPDRSSRGSGGRGSTRLPSPSS